MIAPLRCRRRTIGAITLVSAESGRRFDAADLSLAEELASAAALAVGRRGYIAMHNTRVAPKTNFL
jgi:GAF domain-containing protein